MKFQETNTSRKIYAQLLLIYILNPGTFCKCNDTVMQPFSRNHRLRFSDNKFNSSVQKLQL